MTVTSAVSSAMLVLLTSLGVAQTSISSGQPAPLHPPQLDVNWLYGAYVPKDAPLRPLTGGQRFKLYLRQSFTTPGIYVKTGLFSIGDQLNNSPPDWGTGAAGFARRFGSRQGQFVVQNSLSAFGNAILGYEPRYDRCRCSGFWLRARHASVRNFLTYDRTESFPRPQLPLFGAAFGAGVVAGTWKANDHDLVAEGYRGLITQAAFGLAANRVGEFAPDVLHKLRAKKNPGR